MRITPVLLSLLILCFLSSPVVRAADTLSVASPSGQIRVSIWMEKKLNYRVSFNGESLLEPSVIDMLVLGKQAMSASGRIASSPVKAIRETIISPIPEKRSVVPDVYNLLTISFRQSYKVEFRVYDDGVAYRILTSFRDSIRIEREVAEFNFPGRPSAYFGQVQKRDDADIFHTSFEELYPLLRMDSIMSGTIGFTPVLVTNGDGPKVGITESDLEEYPGMFLEGTGGPSLTAIYAGYPLEEQATEGTFPQMKVTRRAGYIAHTAGRRSFPWRVMLIAKEDKDLPGNDLVFRLGSPSRIKDVSWIKPGNLTDEWITDINLFNVPFRAGLNTTSYKYYIDFAKRFGFDRILMDAGWSDNTDLFKINPAISMDTLAAYAREKGIGLSMWTLASTLDRQLDSALNQFNKWGVDFIMTDFMDRDDQKMVGFYHRIAKACAEHRVMIMYHGAFPPKGFNRTYPNAVGREGVLGSEFNNWSDRVTPDHDVTIPFTRMLAGGFDYEPGLLNNATQRQTRPVTGVVTSPGTRSHQLAMFIVYDSPMQIFSGNPSEGMREPEFMQLLGGLPTMWDETIIPDAQVGKFIVTARRKGTEWYLAGMTGWEARDLTVSMDFLDGENYRATICKDGINADRYAGDYVISRDTPVMKTDKLTIHLAPGGGFLIKLEKAPGR